jgi:RNA polymerase sigma-70 factor (ECF subfamily)
MTVSAVQQQNEQLPFAEVVTLHQKAVYSYLLRFTCNPHDAQDLFQETFLRAHRAYPALPTNADRRAWLMRIAVNLTKNYIRDRHRRNRVLVDESHVPSTERKLLSQTSMGTEETMISREIAHTLMAAINALPFRQRAALVQRQFEGLDYQTIAANLECSPDTARAHVYQALRKLRLSLQTPETQEG